MTMLGRRRKCLRIRSEKRRFRDLMSTRGKTGLLRRGGRPFALKTRLDLCVCKPNSLGVSLNQDLKRKFRLRIQAPNQARGHR